jgi:hypothetical protein
LIYFEAAVALAVLDPKSSWLSAILLAVSLYVVHVIALARGLRQPYVEKDYVRALVCLLYLIPGLFGAALGLAHGPRELLKRGRTSGASPQTPFSALGEGPPVCA